MTKLKMQTPDLTAQNIEKIAELFPNCITETVDENGQPKKAVNFAVLKQMLSGEVLDGDEAYEFTWVGKKASIVEANRPIRKTLRPCIEESRNWDGTENLYIEGDNLEVLKLLQESYLGKVKMIYIDPPYNTGNDFIYRDDFKQTAAEYDEESGVFDEDENRLFKNTDSNGRFHSDWCSMIYPRLLLARNFLADDGVIFISIADVNNGGDSHNLRKICDEIFGEINCLCNAIWDLGTGTSAGHFTRSHEYILIYAKKKKVLSNFEAISDDNIVHGALKKISRANPATELTFPVGFPFEGDSAVFSGVLGGSEQEFILSDKMEFKDGKLLYPTTIKAGWGMANQVRDWIAGKATYDTKGQKIVRFYFNKQGILFYEKERGTYNPKSVFSDIANTKNGSSELESIFGSNYFDFPKPVGLLKHLILLVSRKDDIVLDFFSGSATTAHAVMQLNAEDGGNRKFIMVQLPEPCDEKSEAYKAGYKNICEIGKERIRRAGDKIKAETGADIDYGFRVFKVDDSNMNDIYYSVAELSQTTLASTLDNIKPDRSALDLLFGCLLDWGLPLSMPYKSEQLGGCTVHTYNEGDLLACFDMDIPEEVLVELAKRQPLRAVFRDSCFADSPAKINVFEIFKLYAPDCTVKVL